MRAYFYKETIKVTPSPKDDGWRIWLWLKEPLTKGNKPYVYVDTVKGQKRYSLPCPMANIYGAVVERK